MPVAEISLPETIAQAYAKINELVREINVIDAQLQVNITAATQAAFTVAGAPDANDDSADTNGNGAAEINSLWVDTSASPKEAYRCVDATPTAAIWLNTTLEVGDLGALAVLSAVGSAQITDDSIVNADINSAAAIALSKLAVDPLARANHTGTQLMATISDAGALATLSAVGSAEITNDSILDADINSAAAIALSKLATDPLARANHTGTQLMATISDAGALATLSAVGSAEITNDSILDADINSAAAIALSKLATDPLARANHTGTQLASTISDLESTITTTAREYTATQNFNATSLVALGADAVTNGGFAADTDWTKGTGWTIAAGVASSDGTQAGDADLTQALSLVSGQTYEVEFTVSNYSAGNVTPVAGDVEGTDRAANGTFTENIVAGAGGDIDIRADLNFIGDIDDVTVRLANTSWDAAANQVTKLTLDGNLVLDNPSNLVDGATYIITLTQDAVGTRLLSYGSAYKFPGGVAPTLSTGVNDVDVITFVSDGTNMYGVFQGDFS